MIQSPPLQLPRLSKRSQSKSATLEVLEKLVKDEEHFVVHEADKHGKIIEHGYRGIFVQKKPAHTINGSLIYPRIDKGIHGTLQGFMKLNHIKFSSQFSKAYMEFDLPKLMSMNDTVRIYRGQYTKVLESGFNTIETHCVVMRR